MVKLLKRWFFRARYRFEPCHPPEVECTHLEFDNAARKSIGRNLLNPGGPLIAGDSLELWNKERTRVISILATDVWQ